MLSVMGVFAEFKRSRIRERQKEDIAPPLRLTDTAFTADELLGEWILVRENRVQQEQHHLISVLKEAGLNRKPGPVHYDLMGHDFTEACQTN
jgi:hypothetical protein